MAKLIIYGAPPSNFVRTVRIACHEKGVAYELREADLESPDYIELNPFARMPAMRHGDVTLFEALAIATYVDKAFDGPPLVPAEPVAAARTMQWISAFLDMVAVHLGRGVLYERLAKPYFGQPTDEEKIKASLPKVERIMQVLDDALGKSAYFGGKAATLADAYYISQFHYVPMCPDTEALVATKDNIGRWMERMNERASVKSTVPVFDSEKAA